MLNNHNPQIMPRQNRQSRQIKLRCRTFWKRVVFLNHFTLINILNNNSGPFKSQHFIIRLHIKQVVSKYCKQVPMIHTFPVTCLLSLFFLAASVSVIVFYNLCRNRLKLFDASFCHVWVSNDCFYNFTLQGKLGFQESVTNVENETNVKYVHSPTGYQDIYCWDKKKKNQKKSWIPLFEHRL